MDERVQYLLSLEAVRERSKIVYEAAQVGGLTHFEYHPSRMDAAADYVASLIKRDFGPDRFEMIPPHGRWQHFEVGSKPRVTKMLDEWRQAGCDEKECTRRLIDLFFVSVLLDAGAGDTWVFTEPGTGEKYSRSEGLAVASLYMFSAGEFANPESEVKQRVDSRGLQTLTPEKLGNGLQASSNNEIPGVSSRAALLQALGRSLSKHPDIFGEEGRPGNLVDSLIKSSSHGILDVKDLWTTLQLLLIPCWPKDRTNISGVAIGDAWHLSTLQKGTDPDRSLGIQPFHKLTQWLTYSLMVPFGRVLGYKWKNTNLLTGLPEYRNGGLFVDMGVLTLKEEALARGLKASGTALPVFEAGDDVIVEWRALTLQLLDALYQMILSRLGVDLSMAQVLEAGTWKAGRELAAEHRPETKSSPLVISSDGTVF
ncbi:MAG: hypothetical protein M1818_007779 [Claussenomyces sp. TS43310]|nr:MAG: hypothetical protein M1818_007779 [Claussenomyces sp. TS43310]